MILGANSPGSLYSGKGSGGYSRHKPDCSVVQGNPQLFPWDVLKGTRLEAARTRQGGESRSFPASDAECFSRDAHGVERLKESREGDQKPRRGSRGLGEGLMGLTAHWVLWAGSTQSSCMGKVIAKKNVSF